MATSTRAEESPDEQAVREQRTSWRVGVGLWLLGAVTLLATLPAPDPDPSDHGTILAVGLGSCVVAALLWLFGRTRPYLLALSPIAGVMAVAVVVADASPLAVVPLFMLWPVLHAAYFFPRRHLLVVLGVMTVSYGVALAGFSDTDLKLTYFTSVTVGISSASLLISRLRERLEETIVALRESAATDPLTGLRNRRAFDSAVEEALARSERDGSPLSLAMLDVDHFKRVNDMFGHAEGDRALQRVAEALRAEGRVGDLLARMGGEEFAVLLPGAPLAEAHAAAVRICRRLAELTSGDLALLGLSVGVTEVSTTVDTSDRLLLAADAALYEAKVSGRGRVVSTDGEKTLLDEVGAPRVAAG